MRSSTFMSAPNRPFSTTSTWVLHLSIKCLYRDSAIWGAPAFIKLGLFPLRQSAYRVNWLTTRSSPSTSSSDRLVFPFSSSNIRRRQILSAIFSAICRVSPSATPNSIRNPLPILPNNSPSTVTLACVTRCTTALICYYLLLSQHHFQIFHKRLGGFLPVEYLPGPHRIICDDIVHA